MRDQDLITIEFIVVGGSISGLTAAVGLARHGHKVTIVDDYGSFHETPMSGACRIPPNATKILYRWGMEEAIRKVAIKSTGVCFAQFDSGDFIGTHDWEVMEETGGEFLLMHFADLRRILADCALEHGVTLRPSTRIVDVKADPQRPYVTLTSGEVLSADVVVGADGCHVAYRCRRAILEATPQEDIEKPGGYQLFNVLIPASALGQIDDPHGLGESRQSGRMFTWFGSSYGALGYPLKEAGTGNPLFTLLVYVLREDEDFEVVYADKEDLLKYLEGCDPWLITLAQAATKVICVPMVERPFLDQWVHPHGKLICIGEAAHPISAGSIYALGMAVGDAAVLGKLFSHLHRREQITTFLHAVQEIRAQRVERILHACVGNVFAVSVPPGIAAARDRSLHNRTEENIKNLGTGGSQTSQEMVQVIEGIFAYDPEDEADNWWQKWGITQERAHRLFSSEPIHVGDRHEEEHV